jgi:hypothetical protein
VIAEPSAGDDVDDDGPLVVIRVPPGLPQGQAPPWGLQAEEGGPIGPVVDVILRLGTQVVRHARGHGQWVVGGGAGPGSRNGRPDGFELENPSGLIPHFRTRGGYQGLLTLRRHTRLSLPGILRGTLR